MSDDLWDVIDGVPETPKKPADHPWHLKASPMATAVSDLVTYGQGKIQNVFLERFRYAFEQRFGYALLRDARVETIYEAFEREAIHRLEIGLLGRRVHTHETTVFEVPDTTENKVRARLREWADRFLPEAWSRKATVTLQPRINLVETRQTHVHVCPHLDFATQGDHVGFLVQGPERRDEHLVKALARRLLAVLKGADTVTPFLAGDRLHPWYDLLEELRGIEVVLRRMAND